MAIIESNKSKKTEVETKKTKEPEDNSNLCTICCEKERDCILLNCMHFSTCFTCAADWLKKQKTCPICRKEVTSHQRVIKS